MQWNGIYKLKRTIYINTYNNMNEEYTSIH